MMPCLVLSTRRGQPKGEHDRIGAAALELVQRFHRQRVDVVELAGHGGFGAGVGVAHRHEADFVQVLLAGTAVAVGLAFALLVAVEAHQLDVLVRHARLELVGPVPTISVRTGAILPLGMMTAAALFMASSAVSGE